MDSVRCPTCHSMLLEPDPARCPSCHKRLHRRTLSLFGGRSKTSGRSPAHLDLVLQEQREAEIKATHHVAPDVPAPAPIAYVTAPVAPAPVDAPPVAVPVAAPPIAAPPIAAPPVSAPSVAVPPVDAPSVWASPAVEAPPVEPPPVDAPFVWSVPRVEAPRVEARPVATTPTWVTRVEAPLIAAPPPVAVEPLVEHTAIFQPSQIDPEMRSILDDLYRKARAEQDDRKK